MEIPIYQIDAFASELFEGNPAAVCPLDEWLPDETMQSISTENNLSETAFFVPKGSRFHIRWFTPNAEVDLCGHATMASAYVLFDILDYELEVIIVERHELIQAVNRHLVIGGGNQSCINGVVGSDYITVEYCRCCSTNNDEQHDE